MKHLLTLLAAILTANAAVVLMPGTALAESPSDHPWQASWIGSPVPPPLDLTGANWIWSDEPGIDPAVNAPGGSRQFHREFQLTGSERIVSAVAAFTADNRYKLVINGQEIGTGDDWRSAKSFDITSALRLGGNRIVIQADNDGDSNAAGLIGKIRIEREGASTQEIVTDARWSCAGLIRAQVPESSGLGEKAEPAWVAVKVLGGVGIAPWGPISGSSLGGSSNLWTCFRKSFSLTSVPSSAPARIAVDSKYWLWVNGTLVVREGGLKRGPNPQDTYFDVVDLAPYLISGQNQIAVLAWYFGKDGFSHKSSGKAGLLFELDNGGVTILSDTRWKVRRHPAFGKASTEQNPRLSESSVRFDASLDIPGWTGAGYNDSTWISASILGAALSAPWNGLWQRDIPQWKDFGLKDYENAAALPTTSTGAPVSAKLPYNAQVTPWLKVSATAGLLIKMGTDNTANEINAEYITKDGVQEFETPAWMSGHNVVYQIPPGVEILGLKYRESGFNTEFTGAFTCDNEFFNKLWKKSERTLYINMRDTFFDCPDRERAQWWGDVVIQLGQVFYSLDTRAHSLIRKAMYNLANWQQPTKTFFSPIPAGNWNKELPQQMLASIGKYGFWTYYLNTGDAATIRDLYPRVKDYLSIWQTDGDGLIIHRIGENGWDWGDWGSEVDMRMLDNAWFCLALEGAANMAEVAGQPAEATAFRLQRTALITAINNRFWNGSAYRDPGYSGATDDRSNGLAVVAGIAGPDKYPAIKAVLATQRHASPYMEKYVLESLFQMDDPAASLARMQSRYQVMVDSPLTTLWELFDLSGTINHAWTGGPLTLLNQYVAGVAPTAPGFASYHVMPRLGGIKTIDAGFDTVRGRIELAIIRNDDSFKLDITSPAGTEATVYIPLATYGFTAIRVGGQPLWLNGASNGVVPGVTPLGEAAGYVRFSVVPGAWTFEAR